MDTHIFEGKVPGMHKEVKLIVFLSYACRGRAM
jgi:hypothetical protein